MIPNDNCPDFSIAPPRESIVEIHRTSSLEHLYFHSEYLRALFR